MKFPFLSPGRKAAAAALLVGVLTAVPALAQLPTMGDPGDVTTSAERRMGEKIARELYRDPDYIDDPVLAEYVQGIWQPLLGAARARGELNADIDQRFAWQILLGKDREINAFALPGGWLGLNLGLVSATTTPDEVAAVLAHELSHVTQRHISRMVTQQNQQTPWMIAAMLLGAMALSRSPDAGGALITGGQAVAAQQQLNFSRDMEREADRIGFGVATQAGFNPQAFVTMFEKLQQVARLNDNGNYPYLRTHPMTTERIADMQARQELAPHKPLVPTLVHALMSARARVISNPGVDALRAAVAEADASGFAALPRVRQAGVLYAATYAAFRLHDAALTAKMLARLDAAVAADPAGERQARLLGAEIALARGDGASVLRMLDVNSKHRPEVLLTAQAQTQTGHAAQAADRLQTWVTARPRDATAWQLLSAAYAAEKQPLRAVRADAEAHVAQLDYAAALDRFKAAQDMVRKGGGDYIEASIIDSRTRQVESALREQSLER